jgi:hypothetical protein
MSLTQANERVARWCHTQNTWVVEDRTTYRWVCNHTGQAISEWLPTFDLALGFLVKSGV